jgi:hypothetical protein
VSRDILQKVLCSNRFVTRDLSTWSYCYSSPIILIYELRENNSDIVGEVRWWVAAVFDTPFDAGLRHLAEVQKLHNLGESGIRNARTCLCESGHFHGDMLSAQHVCVGK